MVNILSVMGTALMWICLPITVASRVSDPFLRSVTAVNCLLSGLGALSGSFLGCLLFTDSLDPYLLSLSLSTGILSLSSASLYILNPGLTLGLSCLASFLMIVLLTKSQILRAFSNPQFALYNPSLSALMHVIPGVVGMLVRVSVEAYA